MPSHARSRSLLAALAALSVVLAPAVVAAPASAAVAAAPASAATVDALVINEVNSNPDDWFELANLTADDLDLNGLWYVDSATDDPEHWVALSGSVPADGVLAIDSTVGLGKGDSVSIYQGDKAAFDAGTAVLVDTVTWPVGVHATSMGLCTPGAADLVAMTPTKGAVNECVAVGADAIRINEVSSDPQDWVELVNIGPAAVDVTGWMLSDNARLSDPTHLQTIPAGTSIAAGGFLTVDYTVAGLGKGDEANLYLPDGVTNVDTTTWPADTHATTWGRCPDGSGVFQSTTATPGAANVCAVTPPPALDPNWDDIEINEIASLNADDPGNPGFGDAVELANTGAQDVTIQGWYQTDSGAASGASALTLADLKTWDGDSLEPATSWIIPAGGYVAFSSKKGLSGEGDSVKIYGPGADAGVRQLVDEQAYGDGDAGVSDTYESDARASAACPDGSDEFWRVTESSFGRDNSASCETKSRRLDTAVLLNEVSNVGGKAELLNVGTSPVDVSGWELVDSEGDVVHTVPVPTTILAGGFYVAQSIAGLESVDSLTIRSTSGATVVGHTWFEDGIASYSRCEVFGSVTYVETPTATWGAANACPTLQTETWPGAGTVRIVDAVDAFTDLDANDEGDVSGAAFDPNDPTVLWVAMNKGRLFKMHLVGGLYTAFPEWAGGIPVRFADGGGELDAEGVTVGPDGAVYLTSERDNLRAKGTSYNKVARYDVSAVTATTTELVATHEWDVNGFVPTGTNLGLEGITYVPDAYLVNSGWKVDGVAYSATAYPTPGLFVTAVEGTGALHFFSLPVGGAAVEVKVEASGFPWSMDVAYDADRGALWALCDDGCGGAYNLLKVVDGDFEVARSYARPAGMPNLNNEGMAIAPASTCVDGFQEVVWADDGDTDGFSLRSGTLPCPTTGGPTDPGTDPGSDPGTGPGTDPGTDPATDEQLTDSSRGDVVAPDAVVAGQTITVYVGTRYAGDTVWVWLHSTPISLGAHVVAADGTVTVVLPAGIEAGAHRIVVLDAEGNVLGWTEVTVTEALAATGSTPGPVAGSASLAAALLIAGAAALVLRRRSAALT
ncbi:UNVERIFIED_CONTAM: lamin tail domain-containing protein [Microbacterium sp. SLM126]